MSNEKINKLDTEAKALYDLAIDHGLIKKPKRTRKDNSKNLIETIIIQMTDTGGA